ncbi:MAG TPA: hypothetical protein VF875_01385 [Anaeromyxobacter sp.]
MSFLVAAALVALAGLAVLRILRLGSGHPAADLPLAWLVGSGWVAAVVPVARFAAGLPLGRPSLLVVLLAPPAAWAALGWRARRAAAAERAGAQAGATSGAGREGAPGEGARWLPRPLWVFIPIAAYVVIVLAMTLLHGANTPTQTDDGERVRAFAPMLAFEDGWPPEARAILSIAGPLSTFVPVVGWVLSGTLDHFHVNYAILADLVALVALTVALASSRGAPERGWASAFGLLTLPLFVFHATSTYSDAVLAMRVGAAILFTVEYARRGDRADARLALLLLGIAAMVKREGELVAAAPAAVLVLWLVKEARDGRPFPWRSLALLVAPLMLCATGKIAAAGLLGAFPMLAFMAEQAGEVVTGTAPVQVTHEVATLFFDRALFRLGDQGMLYWIAAATIAVRARAIVRGRELWPLLAVGALFGEVLVSSVFLVPEFTLNHGTVHRALLVVSVPLALWTASTIADAVRAEAHAPSTAPAKGAPGGEGAEDATRPARRRARRRRRP